jgi:SRSO17 transposase
MLGGLPRKDQRAKGELYVRGLLGEGRRKSMQPMAERLGVDCQQFQQFITSSTWDCTRVRRNVARWAVPVIGPVAYVVDDTGLPKDGDASRAWPASTAASSPGTARSGSWPWTCSTRRSTTGDCPS